MVEQQVSHPAGNGVIATADAVHQIDQRNGFVGLVGDVGPIVVLLDRQGIWVVGEGNLDDRTAGGVNQVQGVLILADGQRASRAAASTTAPRPPRE